MERSIAILFTFRQFQTCIILSCNSNRVLSHHDKAVCLQVALPREMYWH